MEVGERAERGVVLVEDAVGQVGGVASAEIEVWGDAAEGALEAVADVEGDAAGAETVGLVAGGRGNEAGKLVLESARDELSVETEDDVAGYAALVDEQCVGLGVGGETVGETKHIDGDGGIDGEGVVEAVADRWNEDGCPAGGGFMDAGDGSSGVQAAQRG